MFDQHYKAGPYTRGTLWDFWPLEFAIFNVLRAADNTLPEFYQTEFWRYSRLDQFFQMLRQTEMAEYPLFENYVGAIAGKLGGTNGTLSAIATELFLQTQVTWQPGLTASRLATTEGKLGDIHLSGNGLEAWVEAKNIESQDGYSFDEHIYFARGIDAASNLINQSTEIGISRLIEVSVPHKVLVDDKGKTFIKELKDVLSKGSGGNNAFRVICEMQAPLAVNDLLKWHRDIRTAEYDYKTVTDRTTGVGMLFAIPFRGDGLRQKVALIVRNAVKEQTGLGEAVICLVYDFASIAPLATEADLRQWKTGVDILHRQMAIASYERSGTVRKRLNNLIGIALLPPCPHLGEQPFLECFEHFLEGHDPHIKADLINSRGMVREMKGKSAIRDHYQALMDLYGQRISHKPQESPNIPEPE